MDNTEKTPLGSTTSEAGVSATPGAKQATRVWRDTIPGRKGVEKPDPSSIANIEDYLNAIGVKVWRDAFAGDIKIDSKAGTQPLSDVHESSLWGDLNAQGLRASPVFLHDALVFIAGKHTRNPVVEYIDQCAKDWDRVKRIDRIFIDMLGAEDTPLNKSIGRAFMLSLVGRAKVPGCQLFGFPILEDHKGGSGKSSFAEDLVGQARYLSGMPLDADSKRVLEDTMNTWLFEASELVGMNSAKGFEAVKEFVTRRTDVASKKYARVTSAVPRHFALIGTTNADDYMPPHAGGLRRLWPVKVGLGGFKYDPKALAKIRGWLFGEAAVALAAGETPNIPEELWPAEAEAREERMASTPLEDLLAPVIEGKEGFLPNAALREYVLGAKMEYDRLARSGTLNGVLRKLGLKRVKYGGERGFLSGDDPSIELTLSKEDTAKAKRAAAEKAELGRLRTAETMRKAAARQAESMKARVLSPDALSGDGSRRGVAPLQVVKTPEERPAMSFAQRLKSQTK